jgi:hypothetical protein
VMAHPRLVSIWYSDDPDTVRLGQFADWIVTSKWLTQVGGEYGVQAGSVLGAVTLSTAAPNFIAPDDIPGKIFDLIDAGTVPSPPGDDFANTLYMLYFPTHTLVQDSSSQSCKEYLGYHASARRNGREISYAVLPTCPGGIANLSTIETRQEVASHEIIEAATDPLPGNNPGYQVADNSNSWIALGNEVADLCSRGDDSRIWRESGFVAQRSWSAKAAQTGEPCVPIAAPPVSPYFNVFVTPAGVQHGSPNGVLRYQIRAYAADPSIKQIDLIAFSMTNDNPTFKFGTGTINVGQETTLDITLPNTVAEIQVALIPRTTLDYQFIPLRIAMGQPCSASKDCVTCGNQDACGWCAKSSRCENLGPNGSADSDCSGDDFAQSPGGCPGFCAGHSSSCNDCASQFGCGWCQTASGAQCFPYAGNGSSPKGATCAYADWSLSPDYCP